MWHLLWHLFILNISNALLALARQNLQGVNAVRALNNYQP